MNNRKEVINLPLEEILPNRFQPRIKFDEQAITELSESIKEHGVIQPIIVRGIGDKYEIIAGERRYKASVMAGKTHIPAIVVSLNDKDASEIALIENVQRQDLTPIEEAISYRKILDMGYLTQEDLATKLGVAQSTVANKLRLLNLDDEVQDALLEEKISERHARSLLKLSKASMQREMLKKIINERLTVRKTDEEIEKMMKEKETGVFDSIENTMMNNMNDFNQNNVFNNESSAFNLNSNNSFNENLTSVTPDSNSFVNNEQANFSVDTDTVNNNLNTIVPNSNDIEIIDFADTNETFNIPSMPIVEDIKESSVQENTFTPEVNNVESFNIPNEVEMAVPSFENNSFEEPTTNLNNDVNTSSVENTEDDETDGADERILKPGRFFNILNYDNDEPEKEETPSVDTVSDSTPNTFSFNAFNMNNENNQDDEKEIKDFNQQLVEEPINTPNENINEFNNQMFSIPNDFDRPIEPVTPVYENQTEESEEKKATLKDIIALIRKCADDIEKNDFEIDTEEFDFDDIYQVIFKIKK